LMNMISSEQAVAWNHHRHLHSAVNQMIVSGIPEKEKERFLSQVDYGNLIEERSLEGWVGFVFKP